MKWKAILSTALLVSGIAIASPAFAQGQGQQGQPAQPQGQPGQPQNQPPVGAIVGVCSTTDYTDVVAKALGMTAPELRLALVSGKSIDDLASSKNVSTDTITQAVDAARKADLDQAVKDGLLTQDQADQITQNQNNRPSNPSAPAGNNAMGGMRPRPDRYGVSDHNVVKPFIVASNAIGVSCADLAKAAMQGKSIVQVATDKNVQVQTVIDALVKAYKDAIAQDVKEGLISQAEADARTANLTERVTQMISQPFGLRGPGFGPMGGRPGDGFGGQGGFGPGGFGPQGGFGGNRPGGFGPGGDGNGSDGGNNLQAPATPAATQQ